MTNAAVPNPRPQNPQVNDTWTDDAGELWYWDGTAWVLDEDPPELPGGDPVPPWLEREA